MRVWLICLVLSSLPVLANAGPWPRDKGASFLSISTTVWTSMRAPGVDLHSYGAVYLEHGVRPRLTFGLDAGIDATADYTVVVFVRRALDFGGTHSKFAYQTGIGAVNAPFASGGFEYLVQAGASWGRGLNTDFGTGWTVLEVSSLYNVAQRSLATKADLTLGIKPVKTLKLMLQFQAGDYPGSKPYLRLAPAVARKFGAHTHVELGAQIGVINDDSMGLKLGTWLEF